MRCWRAKKASFFAASERGKQDVKNNTAGLEFLTVFGFMKFGTSALKEWGDELFFYRTGIALEIWNNKKDIHD